LNAGGSSIVALESVASAPSTSAADEYRSAGSFSMQRITTASSSAGTGRISDGGTTGSCTCRYSVARGVSATNGACPVSM
jgi:hypothetical protein